MGSQPVLMPMNVSTKNITNRMTTAIISAIMLIARAFSHPQSKKCFTKANHITSSTMYDSQDSKTELKSS
jgi:hypothetical protein